MGFIHRDSYSDPSLVSDLIEEWRPVLVDSMVMGMISRHEVDINDFEKSEGFYLNNKGFHKFAVAFEQRLKGRNNYIAYPIAGVTGIICMGARVTNFHSNLQEDTMVI